VDCVRGDAECLASGEDGLMVQKMLDGIYKSFEAGREIRIA
jgi:predicted dehydrogenase